MGTRQLLGLIALSLLVTLLNACKPLSVDDPTYYCFAQHVAEKPCDPYGFELGRHEPAMHTLAPPVLLYWLAGAMRLLGQEIWLCKLALAPFSLLLALTLYDLIGRFCPGLAGRLTAVTMLSPAFLPSWNLMLDLPALALELGAMALFLRAIEQGSWRLAAGAGLTAGLAMQTKYSALVVPAVMVWWGCVRGRGGLGVVAAGLALALFGAWEVWLIHVYGESHFLYAASQRAEGLIHKARLALPLLSILGGVAPWMGLLGLAALGARRLGLATLAATGVFLAIALLPNHWPFQRLNDADQGPELLLPNVLFGVLGSLLVLILVPVCRRLAKTPGGDAAAQPNNYGPFGVARIEIDTPSPGHDRHRDTSFLFGWLLFELLGYFAMSPFAAVRRVLGLQVVATLLIGRLAATTWPVARSRLNWGLGLGVALGLGFWLVDLSETLTECRSAHFAAQWIRRQSPNARIWFVGHYPFHFYACQSGMLPLLKEEIAGPDDWIVMAPVELPVPNVGTVGRTCHELVFTDPLPLRTRPNFYAGGRPIEHLEGERLVVRIYGLRGRSP